MNRPATVVAAVLLACLCAPAAVAGPRTRVFSLVHAASADCARDALTALRRYRGVQRASFDPIKVELTATLADGVSDRQIVAMIQKACADGVLALPGAGHGSYAPPGAYPAAADARTLVSDGSAVGPLERLRVPAKYTVFDVYADWCAPCRVLDARLREALSGRSDLAVRRLNVVSFRSDLARELGPRLSALPYVVVFTPAGARRDFAGATWKQVAAAVSGQR